MRVTKASMSIRCRRGAREATSYHSAKTAREGVGSCRRYFEASSATLAEAIAEIQVSGTEMIIKSISGIAGVGQRGNLPAVMGQERSKEKQPVTFKVQINSAGEAGLRAESET